MTPSKRVTKAELVEHCTAVSAQLKTAQQERQAALMLAGVLALFALLF